VSNFESYSPSSPGINKAFTGNSRDLVLGILF
jgi:hypothetical protein